VKTQHLIVVEPMHFAVARGLVYISAVLLLVGPIATGTGILAATGAVVAGMALSRRSLVSQLRWPMILMTAIAFVVLGSGLGSLLGQPLWLSRLIGARPVLAVGEGLTFGLTTLGIIFGLRALACRARSLGALEVLAVASVVVGIFSAHRDSKLSQPRFFTDWAFSQGYDLKLVLLTIGLATFAACALLLMRSDRPLRTLASLLALFCLCSLGFVVLGKSLPDFSAGRDGTAAQSDDDAPSFTPPPRGEHPKPMAIVSLRDDLERAAGGLYFRMNVYSQFNESRLVRAVLAGFDADVPARFVTEREQFPVGPLDPRRCKLVPMTVSLISPHSRPLGLVNVQSMEPRQNADPKSFIRTYSVTSKVLTLSWIDLGAMKAGDSPWSQAVWAHYVAGPADARYRQLADKIIAESINDKFLKPEYQGSAVFRALAIKRWLEKNTIYTLKPVVLEGLDPTTSFLFGDRRGYCVHVAHAMAYLLRSLGIPARTAGGYFVGAERGGTGSAILLQDTDAHSWAEIYLDEVGWIVMDASPERSEEPPTPTADATAQSHYGETNRRADEPDVYRDPPTPPKQALFWPVLILAGLLIAMYGIKAWWRLFPKLAQERRLHRVCYRSVLDQLAGVGIAREFGETREEFAQRISGWAPKFVELTEAHLRQAIGGSASPGRTYWLGLQSQVARQIAGRFPIHRRILGIIDPSTWLRVR
jgi:hypothetical protein